MVRLSGRIEQYVAVRDGSAQYSTIQHSTVHYSTVHYSTVHYSTVQYSTLQYSTLQYSTLQYCTVLYCTVQHQKQNIPCNAALYDTIRYDAMRRDISSILY
jgi:hypothetical protein